ncbi:ABC transporter permease [Streptomyces sp. Je 1-4]|uniref:ABC transporter permease n=1 Tax=Streptomyces TaxID=1883 RepID=UPI00140EB973|nr:MULTISPECIES: ABC transporter permease [unclassified Streptomyces]QIK06510.1 ABC transporter permease [Streptomyces sp. ID38640]UYB39870.1 ABC transporter permease [Streptomyces sp. Je 1-4]UZQ35930.1 ABC transporter permease [Streptomyces sp. Je 1-4] [Streptomyces sp. Je 1-4 4N24]UZQ43348.1 ABC transporter permease [Streptomyces sp. Je 1-4] [Streptomyces sp. Je 1-4 4N24_ara]
MLRTALRNVLAHKARLMMTALAVLLGVAFVAGTLIFSDTVGEAVKKASTKNLKDVAVSVQAVADDNAPLTGKDGKRTTALDNKVVDTVRALPGVQSVRRNVTGTATLAGPDGIPIGNGWQNLAANFQPDKDGYDARYPLMRGRGPAAGDEIALDEATAKAAGHKLGDSVRFATDGPVLTKKLVGIVTSEDPQVTAGGSLALFDTATAQKLYLHPGQFDELVVGAAPGTDQQSLTAKIREILPKDRAEATSGTELAAEQSRMIAEQNKSLSQTLLVFAGIALFVGIFIIANTFTMLISQRSREIALMRAIGASRRQVVRSVLTEASLLGLVSSVIGFGLGAGIAVGLRAVLDANGAGFPDGPVIISPTAVLSSLAVGVVVTVLAAWLPSRKAAKIAPVEALNTVEAPPALRSLVIRNSLGAVVTGLGVAVMFYVTTLKSSDDMPIAMAGSMLTLTGVIILAPLLSRPLVSLAGVLTTRLFGIGGKLAKENALRNPRRTAATASALMIGLTLITGMTVVGNSAQVATDKMTAKGLKADYKIETSTFVGLDTKLSQKVADIPGVTAMAPVRNSGFEAGDSYLNLVGTDLAAIGKVAQLDFKSGSLAAAGANGIAISQTAAKEHGWQTGETLDASFEDKKKAKLKIAGIYADNQEVGEAIGATSLVDPHLREMKNEKLLVKAADGPTEGLEKQIRHALGDSPLLTVKDHADLRKENAGQIETMLYIMYGLLGMAVIIAVVGVVNTLAMSVFERTREIGMLRAIGLDRSGIKQMVRLESVVISLFGAVLGIGVGIFLSWAGSNLVSEGLPTYELLLPWGRLGLFVLIALVVGVLAALWPARRAARLNMLESIGAQ